MKLSKLITVVLITLFVAACSSEKEPAKEPVKEVPKERVAPVKEELAAPSMDEAKEEATVLAPAMKTLQQAKEVEQKLMDAEEKLEAKIDEETAELKDEDDGE